MISSVFAGKTEHVDTGVQCFLILHYPPLAEESAFSENMGSIIHVHCVAVKYEASCRYATA
jgi:hypothetical protein